MGMAGGKVRLGRVVPMMISDVVMAGFNSNGQKGIFPSNYVRSLPVVVLL